MSEHNTEIEELLSEQGYKKNEEGIFLSGNEGYWSNLSRTENDNFSKNLEKNGTRHAVKDLIPELERMIFSEKREAALEFLHYKKNDLCIDYGCMWGVLSVGMAKRGCKVIAMDQTYDSLKFLKVRSQEECLDNIFSVQDDIKKSSIEESADIALVNGVLEWIPESGDIEINEYYGKKSSKSYAESPETLQREFLATVSRSLKKGGQMMLAIENRYDYSRFIGKKDPHANIYFTSFLPRFFSNLISNIVLERPYRNYIYSFSHLKKILLESGFNSVELYMSFPDYHFPELVLPYTKEGINQYRQYPNEFRITTKQKIAYRFEMLIMKFLKARVLAPAIIAIARK